MEEVEFVEMTHPDVTISAQSTREAFEQVWKARGWKIEGENASPSRPAPPPAASIPPAVPSTSEGVK